MWAQVLQLAYSEAPRYFPFMVGAPDAKRVRRASRSISSDCLGTFQFAVVVCHCLSEKKKVRKMGKKMAGFPEECLLLSKSRQRRKKPAGKPEEMERKAKGSGTGPPACSEVKPAAMEPEKTRLFCQPLRRRPLTRCQRCTDLPQPSDRGSVSHPCGHSLQRSGGCPTQRR